MNKTRFMQVLFSAVEREDEELTKQVATDIENAKENGVVDTDEVTYQHLGDGNVAVTDKETGEVTVATKANDVDDTYDLVAVPDQNLDKYLHPDSDGNPGDIEAFYTQNDILEGQKEFSVSTNNTAVLRIFSDQEFMERLFSEALEKEREYEEDEDGDLVDVTEPVKVGNMKIERDPDAEEDESAIIVTDNETGHQARVVMDGEDMEVTELEQKGYSEMEGASYAGMFEREGYGDEYAPIYLVGIDRSNNQLVSTQVYTEEDLVRLIEQLEQIGVEDIDVFSHQSDARDYSIELLAGEGVNSVDDISDDEVRTFSNTGDRVAVNEYAPGLTRSIRKIFSEQEEDEDLSSELEETIEDAIEKGEQIETEEEIITPVDATTAVVEDKETGEFTKAVVDPKGGLNVEEISEEEAEELTEDLEASEKQFSNNVSNFMLRLYSEAEEGESELQDTVEDAIEKGEQIETDEEIITPVDATTAVVEDKETGEFTKVILDGSEMDIEKIDEEEAEELTEDVVASEKKFSNTVSNFMLRLYSEAEEGESELQDTVEDAIEKGEQVETDEEIITPIDETTAVVEDKGTGEFTKVTLDGEDMDLDKISEEEAEELTEGLEASEKAYSDYTSNFMLRLYSEAEEAEEDLEDGYEPVTELQDLVEDAIENGEEIEDEEYIVTPIDSESAVVEDKETGEFTHVTLEGDEMSADKISEEEAEELTEDIVDEDTVDAIEEAEAEEALEDAIERGDVTEDPIDGELVISPLQKYFSQMAAQQNPNMAPQQGQGQQEVPQLFDANGNPVMVDENGNIVPLDGTQGGPQEGPMPVEAVEDKALAAVQSIQEAAAAAEQSIMQAKEQAVQGNFDPQQQMQQQGQDLREANFSLNGEYMHDGWNYGQSNDTLNNWLNNIK